MATTIFNKDTINPRDLTMFNAFRGVTDFTNINQFSQYEKGYQALFVLQMPYFMEKLEPDLTNSFRHMLEYEFRGLDGLPDITADQMTITDGINEAKLISKVTYDTSVTISSQYFEKTGSLITRWSEMYLTGIKDKNSQAKTYHGLIKAGEVQDPSPDKEIFTMLYVATDATMYRLERAVLLANCQLTKADTSMYNGNRSDIGTNDERTIEWTCYPIMNNAVDAAGRKLLETVNGVKINYVKDKNDGGLIDSVSSPGKISGADYSNIIYSELDSTEYRYGVMNTYQSTRSGGMVNPTSEGVIFQNS